MTDLYEELGVNKNATPEEIKKAYKKASQKHHPDKGGDADKFNQIASAYDVLSDPQRRKDYDRTGNTEKKKGPEATAEQVIYTWLSEILDQLIVPADIVREITDRIDAGRAELRKAERTLNASIAKYNKLLGRVQGGEPDDNFVDNALRKKIRDCELRLSDVEEQFRVSECMSSMIEGYQDREAAATSNAISHHEHLQREKKQAFLRMGVGEFNDMFGGKSW